MDLYMKKYNEIGITSNWITEIEPVKLKISISTNCPSDFLK